MHRHHPGLWTTIGASTSAPYSVSWDNHLLCDGTYALIAKTTADAGNAAYTGIDTVYVDNTPPATTLARTAPTPGSSSRASPSP